MYYTYAYKSVCVHISYDWLILLDPSGFTRDIYLDL